MRIIQMISSISIYNGEKIERGPLWYIISTTIVIFLIIYSFFEWWIMWWISVLFLFLVVVVSYVILYLVAMKKTKLELYEWYLLIWEKKYNLSELLWFNIEIDTKNNRPVVFIVVPVNVWYPLRYSIVSDMDEVKQLSIDLSQQWVPLYSDYENDRYYKIIRKLKLW